MTLVVPLLHRPSLARDLRFVEHAAFVVGTLVVLGGGVLAAKAAAARLGT
jgi:hypothetical protein